MRAAAVSSGFSLAPVVIMFGMVIGLATVAILISQNARTAEVLKAATGGAGDLIKAATSPVTGG
jgi:S1-C subfamily serine protease